MSATVPENLYSGELVSFPGPWSFQVGRENIILVSDQELEAMSDPDKVLDLSLTFDKRQESLRQVCERAKARGCRTLIVAFDHFFKQYRPGQDTPRRLMPDMDEYINRIADISKFAAGYGLGLELSLLSPLEIGSAYQASTGESGAWMHYREGLRDPKTGAFSVQLWRHLQWCNNKGPIAIEDAGVRVFAFRESRVGGTPYRVVDAEAIREITPVAKVQRWEGLQPRLGDFKAQRIRVYGEGMTDIGPLDRVLVVQQYKTPEMDYFSPKALGFLTSLVDRYADAGVKLNALYSDEMHIQQDWGYHNHHDHGELALRYVSDGFAAAFAQRYGEQYRDFAKYLVYFSRGQNDTAIDLSAKQGIMHVLGSSPEQIQQTSLLRSRYYALLQDGVVDLFVKAKRHAEERMGHRLEARAHPTWAESPTCDSWDVGPGNGNRSKYEYTSNFVWSNTVHQAAAACHDYFKWGDFLTGNGNDHAEGGWLDRNYLGLVLGCSTGILNEVPYSYAAHWGMPQAIAHRRWLLQCAYGTAAGPYGAVQDMQHRDVDVLMLYPIDLVAADERFGSWMNQYGYSNLITQAKLLERGRLMEGAVEVAGRRFTTLVATFEPFPSERLLELMQGLVETGGRVIWSGPPPLLTAEGGDALTPWCDIMGVDYRPMRAPGLTVPGRQVTFEGALADVAPQVILTDLLVDHIYPVSVRDTAAVAARVGEHVVGASRAYPTGGSATFLGYRPRDDQSKSLGYETRNWFEVLTALGAYPGSGRFEGVNDNTEYVSRTTDYLACRFPNGTVTIARHLRELEEDWPGGFARNREQDNKWLKEHPLPSDRLELREFKVNGHSVTYRGNGAVAFRVDEQGVLVGFAGGGCREITIDGKTTTFADGDLGHISWAPIPAQRRVEGGAIMQVRADGKATVRIPARGLAEPVQLVAQGGTLGSRGEVIPHTMQDGALVFEATRGLAGRTLYVVPQ